MKKAFFINDEDAILEPNNDILTISLMVMGLVVFASLMSKTYLAYEEHSSILENYGQVNLIAQELACDPVLKGTRSDLISARVLDNMVSGIDNNELKELLYSRYSPGLDLKVEIRTDDGQYRWVISRHDNQKVEHIIASSVPVVIELNPAKRVGAVLTVNLCKREWN